MPSTATAAPAARLASSSRVKLAGSSSGVSQQHQHLTARRQMVAGDHQGMAGPELRLLERDRRRLRPALDLRGHVRHVGG